MSKKTFKILKKVCEEESNIISSEICRVISLASYVSDSCQRDILFYLHISNYIVILRSLLLSFQTMLETKQDYVVVSDEQTKKFSALKEKADEILAELKKYSSFNITVH